MLPSFPYEITAKILKFATLDLLQSERRDYTLIGQANAFLLSASLVSHTWRTIAQPLLRTHGIVHPGLADIFVFNMEKQGALGTLEAVRIGVYANHGPCSAMNRFANWIGLQYLLEKATSLRSLEFVGDEIGFNVHSAVPGLPGGAVRAVAATRIEEVSFTSFRGNKFSLPSDLEGAILATSLTFIESPQGRKYENVIPINCQRFLASATSLYLEVWAFSPIARALYYNHSSAMAHLQALHLEATSTLFHSFLSSTSHHLSLQNIAPLTHLAMHLSPLMNLPTQHSAANPTTLKYPPNLTTVKILRDPADYQTQGTSLTPEEQIITLISEIPPLKELEVPDYWRSDAVEDACEAKGVVLTWSAACE